MTTNTLSRPKIGLLALTLEFYEQLAPGLRESRDEWVRHDLIPALSRGVEVLFHGAVFRREDIAEEVARLEQSGAEVLLVLLLTYAPSQLALPTLQRTRLPIAIWNTQELWKVSTGFTTTEMMNNHGVHGTQDLANVLVRSGVKFHYVTGHVRDAEALAGLQDFGLAAQAVRRLHSARIGLLGYPFPGMGDFAVDTTHLAASLGCAWVNLTVEDYVRRAATADPETVNQLVGEYRRLYALGPDVTEGDLASTARAELALRGMVHDHRLAALTYQFLAFGEDERTATLPFVAASRLMADGLGFGGEGDLIAAAATSFLGWLQPPATFSEMFTIDFADNALFMSHMGEVNVAMARRDRPVRLVARPTPITRTRDRQLALVTSLEPGAATLFALTLGPGQRWRIIAAPARILDFGPLSDACVPHFKLQPARDVRQFLTDYALAGGPHHNGVCFGDGRPRLRHAAAILGADYVEL